MIVCVPGAVDENGRKPFYAEECASMLAVTFSSGGNKLRSIVGLIAAHTYIHRTPGYKPDGAIVSYCLMQVCQISIISLLPQ